MTSPKPRLQTIAISHFCEKARWALDWHGLDYEEKSWAVGLHGVLAKYHGAAATTLPILFDGKTVVQGSGAIIDWADDRARDPARTLTAAHSREIEARADALIGIHVRRLCYAEMLPRQSHLVAAEIFQNLSPLNYALGKAMWPVSRRMMMRAMDITPTAAAESRAILEGELDWLDKQLSDGRPYLAGDRFSRADIAVASLLAPVARPQGMPIFEDMVVPDALMADHRRWRERPIMGFVAELYRSTRFPSSGAKLCAD
jgi:glutathione S-transferase